MSESEVLTLDEAEARFGERVGQMFSNVGLPHLAGRIMGYLLISNTSACTSEELQRALGIAPSSVSTMIRLLERMYYVERLSVPGSRRRLVRARAESWMAVMKDRMRFLQEFKDIADMGLNECPNIGDDARARLKDIKQSTLFVENVFIDAFERWNSERDPSA